MDATDLSRADVVTLSIIILTGITALGIWTAYKLIKDRKKK